ncbi:MAG: Sec-independent protein translocase subunit TatC, partial [Frateuria sp.]|nr:Sec-independent protein translocase subunit TatC [Frateuria sp.]
MASPEPEPQLDLQQGLVSHLIELRSRLLKACAMVLIVLLAL